MAEKRKEVELRALLDDDAYTKLQSFLKDKGEFVVKQDRFLIDYSTFLEGLGERKRDVRVRVTSGQVEIIVKTGPMGRTSREEAAVTVESNDLKSALAVMALLGYRRGVAADRGISRYKVGNVEIAIQEVRYFGQVNRVHSRFMEAEITCDEGYEAEAEAELKQLFDKLEFSPLSEDVWNSYVALLNREVNGIYDHDTGMGFCTIPEREWTAYFTSLTQSSVQ